MKRNLVIYFLGLITLGCLPLSAAAKEPTTATSFNTGVIVPLTGSLAEYGVAIRNGIELAQIESPDKFGSCRFLFEDSEYKNALALTTFNKLTSIDKVALVYVFGGPPGEALAPVAEKKRVPLITDSIDPRVSQGREFVSRYASDKVELGAALASQLQSQGVQNAIIVKVENQYVNSLVEGFLESAQGKFAVEIVASVNPEDSDLKFLIPRIAAREFDALGLFLLPGQISSFAKAVQPHKKDALLFGGDFLESPVELVASEGALEGAIYPNNLVDSDFRSRYVRRFNNQAQIKFAAEG